MNDKKVLYNKMMLGELTLKDVFNFFVKDIYAIEIDEYTYTNFSFEDDEEIGHEENLLIWEHPRYTEQQPGMFSGACRVKIKKDGSFDVDGVKMVFKKAQSINIIESLSNGNRP